MAYKLKRTGDNVADLLTKIENLDLATYTQDGLLSAEDKYKLDHLGIKYGTTEYWNSQHGYVPAAGEIIIYSDYKSKTVDGKTVYIPGIKIGSGNAYVQDLVVANDSSANEELFLEHIRNTDIHTLLSEKMFWNRKLNVTDSQEVIAETLIFNRN